VASCRLRCHMTDNYRYEERAAIIEYDAKVSRMIAEAMADQQERKLQEAERAKAVGIQG